MKHREDSEATKNMTFSVVSTHPSVSFTQFRVFNIYYLEEPTKEHYNNR